MVVMISFGLTMFRLCFISSRSLKGAVAVIAKRTGLLLRALIVSAELT